MESAPAAQPGVPHARQRTILWMAEAVTLAHVARPLAGIRHLAASNWSSVLACDERFAQYVQRGASHVPLESIEPARFLDALQRGAPLYDAATLRRYVEADLRLFEKVRPDLVIGDFRLSLSVSARIAKLPYATLASAYWSPYYRPKPWPVPELPFTRFLPHLVSELMFRSARPLAFALHARPLNDVRRAFGLPSLGTDLRRTYTDADHVLYTDLPELFPIERLPSSHRFVGPALWEPSSRFPDDTELPTDRPLVYVTLGSSGAAALLPSIISALAALPVAAMVATAGRIQLDAVAGNIQLADMLPGIEAAARADLVICNGGSLTGYQALSAGTPVLGIASNLDQFLNMQAIENAGAGRTLRADRFSAASFATAVTQVLGDAGMRNGAARAEGWCKEHDMGDGLREFLATTFADTSARSASVDVAGMRG